MRFCFTNFIFILTQKLNCVNFAKVSKIYTVIDSRILENILQYFISYANILSMENDSKNNKSDIDAETKSICNVVLHKLSAFFKEKRKEKNISLRMFSKVSGVSTAVISDFENEKYLPKLDILIKFALALDMEFNDLLSAMAFDSATIETPDKDLCEAAFTTYLSSKGVKTKDMTEILDFIDFKISKYAPFEESISPLTGLQGRFKGFSPRLPKNP